MVIKINTYAQPIRPLVTTVKCLMKQTDNVIDLAQFRKRKQAQQLARAMWEMYARNAGYQALQWVQASHATRTYNA